MASNEVKRRRGECFHNCIMPLKQNNFIAIQTQLLNKCTLTLVMEVDGDEGDEEELPVKQYTSNNDESAK